MLVTKEMPNPYELDAFETNYMQKTVQFEHQANTKKYQTKNT